MSTAKALEAITDRGQFELLATAILREQSREYRAVVHLGVNSSGETIKSPVDGFVLVPDSVPPHFVIFQCTTTEPNQLERKWLHDRNATKPSGTRSRTENGDLIKAGAKAEECRKKFPGAKFTVVLGTNKCIDQPLMDAVYDKAQQLKITCDIWEQSRFVHELDNTPNGQWLRRNFLGITAQLLSAELLRYICRESSSMYCAKLFDSSGNWVSRDVDRIGVELTNDRGITTNVLIGESGSGKSVTAYKMLSSHLDSGGFGLWIPSEVVESGLSLNDAIRAVLDSLHPGLGPDVSANALKLAAGFNSRLLLVIDDLNQTRNPTDNLQKVLAWANAATAGKKSQQPETRPLLTCPVWPQHWNSLAEARRTSDWIKVTRIGLFSEEESFLPIPL